MAGAYGRGDGSVRSVPGPVFDGRQGVSYVDGDAEAEGSAMTVAIWCTCESGFEAVRDQLARTGRSA